MEQRRDHHDSVCRVNCQPFSVQGFKQHRSRLQAQTSVSGVIVGAVLFYLNSCKLLLTTLPLSARYKVRPPR